MQNLQYASFWERLTAFILDIFIIALPVLIIVTLFTGSFFFDAKTLEKAANPEFEVLYQYYRTGVYYSLTIFAAISLVLALFTTSEWQASPGKRIVNIYIARKNGAPISFADAFGRFISLPLFILMIKIFERREDYAALENLKKSGKIVTDLATLQTSLSGPATGFTALAVFAAILLWFLKIFFSREKTAMHDTLFNTHVLRGKK